MRRNPLFLLLSMGNLLKTNTFHVQTLSDIFYSSFICKGIKFNYHYSLFVRREVQLQDLLEAVAQALGFCITLKNSQEAFYSRSLIFFLLIHHHQSNALCCVSAVCVDFWLALVMLFVVLHYFCMSSVQLHCTGVQFKDNNI